MAFDNASSASGNRISDRQDRSVKISQKGELVTGVLEDFIDVNFQYTIRDVEVDKTETGTGAVSHPGVNGSYAELTPGTGVGKAGIASKQPVVYQAGHETYIEISWIFSTPEATAWKEFVGFWNGVDEFGIGYENDVFGVLFKEGGNFTFYALGSTGAPEFTTYDKLDGTGPSAYVINPQAINVYRVAFGWHGGLPLTVEVQIRNQWWPVAELDFSNVITETHLENPHLPAGGYVERTAGTGTATASRTGSIRGGNIGSGTQLRNDWTAHTNLDQTLTTEARTNIMTFVNPTSWQGKPNHIVYELGIIAFRNAGNKTVAVYGTKGATLTGASAAAFIDEANFALQTRDGGTVTGGVRGPATILGVNERDRIDTRGTGIFVYPGEAFTVEVDPGGVITGTFSASARLIHQA